MIGGIPEIFAKRAIKYLLRRFFGQYLETFKHEELSLSFNKGTAIVENVSFKVEALNAICKEYNLPVDFISGSIDIIVVEIPWSSLFMENSVIEFKGVHFVVQAKKCIEDMSMLSSMWESMTSSYELAEDCLLQKLDTDAELEPSQPAASVEIMTNAFNTVLSKLKLKFTNTTVRVECAVENSNTGVALEVRIKSAEVYDEAGVDASFLKEQNPESSQSASYCIKTCLLQGIEFYTAQFSTEPETDIYASSLPTQLPAGSPEMPPPHHIVHAKRIDNASLQTEPILISRISGLQQFQLSLKQNETVIGPKVDIKVNLGLLTLFLTPYQIEMVINLIRGLAKPGKLGKGSAVTVPARTSSNRPMQPEDIAFVKEEWKEHHRRLGIPSRSLRNTQGWSSHSLEESDEDFHLLTVEPKQAEPQNIPDDLESSYSSSVGSERHSFAGSPSSYESTGTRRPSRGKGSNLQNYMFEATVELTQIHISCSSLLIVALHEDMASHSSNSEQMLIESKTEKNFAFFKSRAMKFFNDLSILSTEGLNFKDFLSVREKLSSLCQTNHLRLLATGVMFEGSDKISSLQQLFNASLSMLDLEILECVYNPSSNGNLGVTYSELVTFKVKNPKTKSSTVPCLKLKYEKCSSNIQRGVKQPANKLVIHLAPVILEVDISLVDRIQYLLNFSSENDSQQERHLFKITENLDPNSMFTLDAFTPNSQRTEVQLFSNFIVLNLRFPIPDLRSPHDMDRMPWWKKNLRDEIFIMELSDASLLFTFDKDQVEKEWNLKCRDFHGLLQMSQKEQPISFMRVSVDPEDEKSTQDGGFNWPLLVIKSVPAVSLDLIGNDFNTVQDPPLMSFADILSANIKNEPSPFCHNSMFCGKKFTHSEDQDDQPTYCDEQIIRPAEKLRMNEFIEQTMNNSEYVFEFTLPAVRIVMPDKNFFEVLKNRLFNDLVMWESAPVKTRSIHEQSGFSFLVPQGNLNPLTKDYSSYAFPNEDAVSGSDDEDKGIFYSVNEHMTRLKQKPIKTKSKALTKFSFFISILKGSMLLHIPAEDEGMDRKASHCGKLQLFLEDSKLFVASSYRGDPRDSFTCLQMNKGSLYHNGRTLMPSETPVVESYIKDAFPNSNKIIYSMEQGVQLNSSAGLKGADIMSLAVHCANDSKQQIKTFKLAIGFCGATLRHYVCPKNELFINQLIQYMCVKDEPIQGYTPSSVVVELHLHLAKCAIDYRPLYMPLKTILTIQEFSLSTNITSANSSLMRIVSEGLRLFLSTDMRLQKVNLKEDYVCVIDTGLIDLSVRVTEIEGKPDPRFEMSMSNDIINIRTCVDSCQALHKLIVYIAENADLNTPEVRAQKTATPAAPQSSASNLGNEASTENMSTMEMKDVERLVAEAIKEYKPNRPDAPNVDTDEDSDDGFIIIEDGFGVGLLDNQQPQMKTLGDDSSRIADNHFPVSSGKLNLLKAPSHFPKPVLVHSLREMSILWCIYGGNDFPLPKTPVKKRVTIKDPAESPNRDDRFDDLSHIKFHSDKAAFCKVTPLTKEFNVNAIHYAMENFSDRAHEQDNGGWIARGGPNRDHKVLMDLFLSKVKFQHEEYSEDSEYASRNVIIIHDLEIRDKMSGSRINKFLHQYSTESMPRQTHANMLLLKYVYVRTDENDYNQECKLKVSCKPLKLNMKQDSVMFLYNFFKDLVQGAPDTPCSSPVAEVKTPIGSPENVSSTSSTGSCPTSPTVLRIPKPSNLTFFRLFKFYPGVLIKLDYNGQRIDMDQGALSGLLLGLGQLERSEVRLKPLTYRRGLLGAEKLITYATNAWINDIRTNQVSSILKGIGPMHPFVQLFQGLRDLVWLPVEQYKKDGQIVRGLQRGASSFSTSTATACLELSTLVIGFIQGAAEVAYDMVSPGPSVTNRQQGGSGVGRQVSQPADVREGVATAYTVVKEGLGDTARAIIRVATVEHEHKGVQGAVGGVLRQIPPAAIKPFIVTAEAACIIIDGVKHQLDPDSHKEAMEKWRTKKH